MMRAVGLTALTLATVCSTQEVEDTFKYFDQAFADVQLLRYKLSGWEALTLQEQQLVYYLTEAGKSGRDIMYDQNYKHNLKIRNALERIYQRYSGDRTTPEWQSFTVYLKRVWFSNGIHHHYSNAKFEPGFTRAYFNGLLAATWTSIDAEAADVIFNDVDAKKVEQASGVDNVALSAVNFYGEGVTNADVLKFYTNISTPDPLRPLSHGLNSKLVKDKNGELKEEVYKVGGLYGKAIEQIVYWLEKAQDVAENAAQGDAIGLLIKFYETGDLQLWDDYNVAWTQATEGNIDYINGFVEVYNDPLGYRGSYEMIVQIKDFEQSARMSVVSDNAQWFEDMSPIMSEHKKPDVVGVSYKTVNVAGGAGDASPASPIGVNLPNANWIRKEVGSKSVSLSNIVGAYGSASGGSLVREFAHDEEEVELELKYGKVADSLHTALHEVIGHASGQINPGVGETKETLKNYASTMEEGRADLVALYYLMDPKLQELGLADDWEAVGKAAYDGYIRNGLVEQLIRLQLGADVEQTHMRNRQYVSAWVFELGRADNVIERVVRDGKTYFNITDYTKLRELFGQLLRELQRIKSEGDYEAAKAIVEGYGVKVDQALHAEVLERNKPIATPPYGGFINPVLVPRYCRRGTIQSISVEYAESFEEQMLEYSRKYDFLARCEHKHARYRRQ